MNFVLERLRTGETAVPTIWPREFTDALQVAARAEGIELLV